MYYTWLGFKHDFKFRLSNLVHKIRTRIPKRTRKLSNSKSLKMELGRFAEAYKVSYIYLTRAYETDESIK